MKWEFNGNYKDYEQVEQFYDFFNNMHDKITKSGGFPYNYIFEGTLGIEDKKQEETAIFLLQQSKTMKSRKQKIEELLKEGYIKIEKGEGTKKFNKIVQVGTDYSKDSTKEFENARAVFEEGFLRGILPKGNKSKGFFAYVDREFFAI